MKATIISGILAILLIGGSFVLTRDGPSSETDTAPENNVSMVDGVQIVEIRAKGGYSDLLRTGHLIVRQRCVFQV